MRGVGIYQIAASSLQFMFFICRLDFK